jgi:hypothetical protein
MPWAVEGIALGSEPRMLLATAAALAVLTAPPAGTGLLPARAARGQVDSVPPAVAVRAERPPILDGRDDDPVWRRAPATSAFQEFVPTEGAPARFRTEFRVAYDDHDLYVFIRMFDPHPDSIMRALSRRDVRGPADQIKILIDSYHDRRSGYEFAVNPVGVKRDYAIYNDQNEDDSWDGVWDVATRIDSLGWTAEFRIPFSQLRYPNAPTHTFGFGIWRDIERFKERVSWPLYRQSRNGLVSQLGDLVGIEGITAFHRIEVIPYAVAKNVSRPDGEAFRRVQQGSTGADIKYGVTPNLTLDATVNPDFGQVEADPAVLNLSAFETFFQEKRPFFVEGTGLYQFGLNCNVVNCNNEGLFYSRRIGRSPQLTGLYGDASSPSATPILGAAKLTGRLASGLAVGVLDAVTDRVAGPASAALEPRTNYAVVRALQDFRNGESGLGFVATDVRREVDQWSADYLRRDASVMGTDFRHRFLGGQYQVSGSLSATRVSGSPRAIAATQTDPVHDFQRPDAGLRFDSTRTSLTGNAEELLFGKYGGGVVRFETSYLRQSTGYEVNDLGYLRRADEQSWSTWAALTFRNARWFYRSAQFNVNQWNFWTAAGLPTDRGVNTNWHINLTNNWWVHIGNTLTQLGTTFCDRCARGGPAVRQSPLWAPWGGFDGDDRRRFVPHLWFNATRKDGGRSTWLSLNPYVDLVPSSRLQATVGTVVSWNHDDTQWLGNFTDSVGATHYAFAHLHQQTLSFNLRLSYTATPTLTLQLYAEPFVSRGSYSNVRALSATPRAVAYLDRYTPYVPPTGTSMGFNFEQLRSNTVLRWEYRPGSTLFLVWTHGRQQFLSTYAGQSWRSEYGDLFGLHPDNTFLLKVAYWLNM